ncbi:MAG: DNA replication/repair protein RecF [Actinomycetota bacterium]|nr:DNA replication/repair protein RecF [Actinomycetota bacterium]
MRVDRLVLEDFRNYTRARAEFDPGLNLIVGRNAQGKTNLLEGIYCLSGLGSPRGPDSSLVREGAERALLHAEIARGERLIEADLEIRPGRGTRALINKTPAPGLSSLSELIVSVFFGPDELSLIKGSPEGRRRFLDDLVVKVRPTRDGLRREWERTLKQRNALLKSAPRSGGKQVLETLEVWDEALCRTGATLTAARLSVLADLTPFVAKRYEAIAGGGEVQLAYESAWLGRDRIVDALAHPRGIDQSVLATELRESIEKVRGRELERGMSLVGPQRDDVVIQLASEGSDAGLLDARLFASQGEQRTSALALKLGEFDLLAEVLGERPILLLDDVFSELDPSRRAWLSDAVRAAGQAVLTSAEPGAIEAAGSGKVIEVVSGRLRAG